MQMCELCGKLTEKLYKVVIEGSEMNVCKECAKFGKSPKTYSRLGKKPTPTSGRTTTKKPVRRKRDLFDSLPVLREDYGDLIREAREKMGLSIEELAKKLKMKSSTLQKFERYELEPNEKEIKILEKWLKISLTENVGEDDQFYSGESDEGFTLGDFIKIKR
ncbi:transcriptional regulator, XRE family [Methanocaldococcus vulcanius M7]|uniref:Transcriptional regulator, XRE family n=1 Tax=Methanocaldococcus vulcanius (strain ATCC 700851 / DSM 12094 / M7) TaxID=579137 RepID=C9RHS8_METVM|nr:multiprotein bridging factor aMBF1 [Methanocaldococcus vulcanius]ACX73130.1 transcriptional regulator, XRE family [Methanocaldococcus vulcanius M7]